MANTEKPKDTKGKTVKKGKRAAPKAQTRLHVVKSIRKSRENWTETVKGYNEKYVQKPFEKGKDFVEDLRESPRKVFDDLVDDGKDFIKDVRKDPRKVVNGFVDDGKDFAEGVKTDIRKGFDEFFESGKGLYGGLEKDTRRIFDGMVDDGKKLVDKIPMVKTIREKMNDGFEAVPDRLNLPSKKDMEKLATAMRALNRKVDGLSKNSLLVKETPVKEDLVKEASM